MELQFLDVLWLHIIIMHNVSVSYISLIKTHQFSNIEFQHCLISISGFSGKCWWRNRGCGNAWSNHTHRRPLHWLFWWRTWSLDRDQRFTALQHGRHVSQQGLWLPRRGDEGSRARCPRKFHADGDPCCCSRHRHQVTNFLTSSKFAKFCKYVVIRFVNR